MRGVEGREEFLGMERRLSMLAVGVLEAEIVAVADRGL
jgi:hypothetical protein